MGFWEKWHFKTNYHAVEDDSSAMELRSFRPEVFSSKSIFTKSVRLLVKSFLEANK